MQIVKSGYIRATRRQKEDHKLRHNCIQLIDNALLILDNPNQQVFDRYWSHICNALIPMSQRKEALYRRLFNYSVKHVKSIIKNNKWNIDFDCKISYDPKEDTLRNADWVNDGMYLLRTYRLWMNDIKCGLPKDFHDSLSALTLSLIFHSAVCDAHYVVVK